MLADQGDYVKTGQVLAGLDPIDLNERLASSRLMAERSARLDPGVAEAQLAQAQSRKTVSSTHSRFVDLHAKGYVSREMLDAKLNEKKCGAGRAGCRYRFSGDTSSVTGKRAQSDASGVAGLRDQTVLLSPVSGIVTARMVEPGVTVALGQTVLQVIDPADIWIKPASTRSRLDLLSGRGQQAEHRAALAAADRRSGSCQTGRYDQRCDHRGTHRECFFAAPESDVILGRICRSHDQASRSGKYPFDIHCGRQTDQPAKGVWVLQDGRAKFKTIKTGIATLDGRTQILDGLGDDDEVIVYSQKAMKDDLK